MFKLAERRGDLDGIYCGPDGLHLGSSPLTGRTGRMFCLRSEREIGALLAAAYDPPPDIGRRIVGGGEQCADLAFATQAKHAAGPPGQRARTEMQPVRPAIDPVKIASPLGQLE